MLSGLVPEKRFHRARQQEFVRAILIRARRQEGALLTPGRAAPGAVWEIRQGRLISGQGRQAGGLIVTTVAFRTPAAVHTPVAAVRPVTVRPALTAAVELLLPGAASPVAAALPAVPAAAFPAPVAVAAADHVPDKWRVKPDS